MENLREGSIGQMFDGFLSRIFERLEHFKNAHIWTNNPQNT